MDPSGGVPSTSGTSGHGQGHDTTLAQIAADQLGLDPAQVAGAPGRHRRVAYGWGTFASRSVVIGGGAVRAAARSWPSASAGSPPTCSRPRPEDLELRDGARLSAAARARPERRRRRPRRLPRGAPAAQGEEPGLECEASFDPPGTFSNATHGVVVELHPGTGAVRDPALRLRRGLRRDDQPDDRRGPGARRRRAGHRRGALRAAHLHGGGPVADRVAHGLPGPDGGRDPRGEIHHLETPWEFTETGAKGIGEGGTIGAPAGVLRRQRRPRAPARARPPADPARRRAGGAARRERKRRSGAP